MSAWQSDTLNRLLKPRKTFSPAAGDAVDQVKADLVVLSAEAVHTKKVDCNLLAEFCTAPGM